MPRWKAAIFLWGVMSLICFVTFVKCSYHWHRVSSHCSILRCSIRYFLILMELAKHSKNFSFSCTKLLIEPRAKLWNQSKTIPFKVQGNSRHWISFITPFPNNEVMWARRWLDGSIFLSKRVIWGILNFDGGRQRECSLTMSWWHPPPVLEAHTSSVHRPC